VGNSLVTDISHSLDEKGGLPEDILGPARKLAHHLGSIITAATSPIDSSTPEMTVKCRKNQSENRV